MTGSLVVIDSDTEGLATGTCDHIKPPDRKGKDKAAFRTGPALVTRQYFKIKSDQDYVLLS